MYLIKGLPDVEDDGESVIVIVSGESQVGVSGIADDEPVPLSGIFSRSHAELISRSQVGKSFVVAL